MKFNPLFLSGFMFLCFNFTTCSTAGSDAGKAINNRQKRSVDFPKIVEGAILEGMGELKIDSFIENLENVNEKNILPIKEFHSYIISNIENANTENFKDRLAVYIYLIDDPEIWIIEEVENKVVIHTEVAPEHIIDSFNGNFSCRKNSYWQEAYNFQSFEKLYAIPFKELKYPILVEVLCF